MELVSTICPSSIVVLLSFASKAVRIARVAVVVKIALDRRSCLTSVHTFCHLCQRKLDITGCLKYNIVLDNYQIEGLLQDLVIVFSCTFTQVSDPELLVLVLLAHPFEEDIYFKVPFPRLSFGCNAPKE